MGQIIISRNTGLQLWCRSVYGSYAVRYNECHEIKYNTETMDKIHGVTQSAGQEVGVGRL